MKASEINFYRFMDGTKQFTIPIYQRTYSWNIEQCEQLWNDIVRVASNKEIPAHFIGSIVYIADIYNISNPTFTVIDGQQRLTTLSLLLCALREKVKKEQNSSLPPEKINNSFLKNLYESGDYQYKLLLTKGDRDIFIDILEGRTSFPIETAPRIVENYNFFSAQLDKMQLSTETFFEGINKLMVVEISLDRNHDNPQLIFESMNSTGLALSQADLIRNYILMGLPNDLQKVLYEQYWFKMEQAFGQTGYTERFDHFVRDYLTMKSPSGVIPKFNEVYEDFKKYTFEKRDQDMENIVKDLDRYARYYVHIAFEKEPDKDLRQCFQNMLLLKVEVIYPLLLEVYDDYEKQVVSKEDFLHLLQLLESYIFRRSIVGIPTNSLNKTFATFSRGLDKTSYRESFVAQLLLQDSYRHFPNDEEFKRNFITRDVYNFRNRMYLLNKLENYDRKEYVPVESYTIEHILPQNENLSANWQEDLGVNWKNIQQKYLHTIGNITLTGYNSELSDRPFMEKRNIKGGFADSPLRLNRELSHLEIWNEELINKRAVNLAELATRIWLFPILPREILQKYIKEEAVKEKTYTLEEHAEYLQGELLDFFNLLRRRILNLDASVREVILKKYIAYKTSSNFVNIMPQKERLVLYLNMDFAEISDPKQACRDVTGIGHYSPGNVEIRFTSPSDIDYIMSLVKQAYDLHSEETL